MGLSYVLAISDIICTRYNMRNEVQRHQLSQPNEQDDSIIGVYSTVMKHDSIIMGICTHSSEVHYE